MDELEELKPQNNKIESKLWDSKKAYMFIPSDINNTLSNY